MGLVFGMVLLLRFRVGVAFEFFDMVSLRFRLLW